ncbi:MAG: hypothetical protein NZ742_04830 [Acidobacteria bacterium]|nr:hypothetical protein [Acidobacteriota bacterium]MDW7983591.1 hypothetical protein [Acidobacteriota bacterium]
MEPDIREKPACRLGRALGSILGVGAVGPILAHLLLLQFDWPARRWKLPDPPPAHLPRWSGWDPGADFRALFWSRWLAGAELDRLPLDARRYAPLADVMALLHGEVDIRQVHRWTACFALMDWWNDRASTPAPPVDIPVRAVSPAYAVLRLWLDLGIQPGPNRRPLGTDRWPDCSRQAERPR